VQLRDRIDILSFPEALKPATRLTRMTWAELCSMEIGEILI
jgi:hypothetical protein